MWVGHVRRVLGGIMRAICFVAAFLSVFASVTACSGPSEDLRVQYLNAIIENVPSGSSGVPGWAPRYRFAERLQAAAQDIPASVDIDGDGQSDAAKLAKTAVKHTGAETYLLAFTETRTRKTHPVPSGTLGSVIAMEAARQHPTCTGLAFEDCAYLLRAKKMEPILRKSDYPKCGSDQFKDLPKLKELLEEMVGCES